MIYAPERFLFLHTPRTAGMSLTVTLVRGLIPHCDLIVNTGAGRHSTIHQVADRYGPQVYRTPFIFAFNRPAEAIRESTLRLVQRDLRDSKLDEPLDPRWRRVLECARDNNGTIPEDSDIYTNLFNWLAKNHECPARMYLGPKLGTVFEYDDLAQAWLTIKSRLPYQECLPDILPILNKA